MNPMQLPGWHFTLAWLLLLSSATALAAKGDVSQVFTLEGELYDTPTGDTPYEGGATIKVRILDSSRNCTLYAESQHVDTTSSSGVFNIEIGSAVGDGKRIAGVDSGHTMAKVFQNLDPIAATGGACAGATYTPALAGGQGRYLRISVTPDAGAEDVLGPDMYVGSVPTALVSQTLQGIGPDGFLQLATVTELTQANLEEVFSDTNFPALQGLLAGVTGNADDVGVNSENGSLLLQTNGTTRAEITNTGDFKIDGSTFVVDASNNRIGMGTGTPSFDFSFAGTTAKTLGMERSTVAGSELAVSAGGAVAGGTNLNGGNLFLKSGISTGMGGSNIYLQTATPAGSSGSADNAPSTKMTLLGNGNVGIGTTSPTSLLHVVQATNNMPMAMFRNDGATVDVTISGNSGVASVRSGVGDSLQLSTNGVDTQGIRVDNSGNVGIGTTAPALKMEITGGTSAPSSSGTAQSGALRIGNSGVGALDIGMIGAGGGGWLQAANTGDLSVKYPLLLNPNGGNVGIGTTSPSRQLHVASGSNATMILEHTGSGADLKKRYLTTSSGEMRFGLFSDDLATATTHLTINSSGNVGIGTTSPTAVLHLKAGTATANTAPLKLTAGTNLTTPEAGAIEFDGTNLYYTNASSARRTLATASGVSGGSTSSTTSTVFNSDSDNSGSDGGFSFQANGSNLLTISNGGVVNVASSTASTSTSTGAMTVGGGLGVAGQVTSGGLAVDTDTLYVDSTNNRVGIGTSSPSALLNVYQGASAHTALAGGTFNIYSNNAASSIFNVTGYSTAPLLNISQNGTSVIHALANGNVGIGTTAPTGILSTKTLINTLNNFVIQADNSTSNTKIAAFTFNRHNYDPTGNAAEISVWRGGAAEEGEIAFATNLGGTPGQSPTERMRISRGGNVGIGTTSPITALDVAGTQRVMSGLTSLTTLTSDTTTSDTTFSVVSTTNYPSSGVLYVYRTTSPYTAEAVSYTGKTATTFTGITRARFGTSAAILLTGFTVDLCTVCIGTSMTAAPIMFVTQGMGIGVGVVQQTWMGANSMKFAGSASFKTLILESGQAVGWGTSSTQIIGSGGSSSSDYINFRTNSGDRMRIDGSGKVGVNTTGPNTTLDVNGQIKGGYTSHAALNTDWATGNIQTTSVAAGTLTFTAGSMFNGSSYTLILTAAGTFTLGTNADITSWRCIPACGSNQIAATGHTVLSILKAGTVGYVSWIAGF